MQKIKIDKLVGFFFILSTVLYIKIFAIALNLGIFIFVFWYSVRLRYSGIFFVLTCPIKVFQKTRSSPFFLYF